MDSGPSQSCQFLVPDRILIRSFLHLSVDLQPDEPASRFQGMFGPYSGLFRFETDRAVEIKALRRDRKFKIVLAQGVVAVANFQSSKMALTNSMMNFDGQDWMNFSRGMSA